MEPVLIFGHRNPDTDSVCSAICLAFLKKQMGMNAEARVIGHLSNETKFVLDYFNVEKPEYLSDVRIQIKDLNYNKKAYVNGNSSINDAVNYMIDKNISGIPIINDKKEVISYINLKDIARFLVRGDYSKVNSSYDNILNTLEGKEVLRFKDDIQGEIIAVSFNSESFINKVKLDENSILIVGDRYKVIEHAINKKVQLLIIVGNKKIDRALIKLAKEKEVNIIVTPFTTYNTSNKMKFCNFIKDLVENNNPYVVDRLEYLNDFTKRVNRLGHTNYPVINNKNECVGMVSLKDMRDYSKKKVILVDHNQILQSVEGIEEAEILEVVDHHNIGTIGTTLPITIRMMPVGATCTIVYTLFKENGIKIPKKIAGLMLSAIICDTLALTSPTTTKMDVEIANVLAKFCGLNIKKFSIDIFKAGSSLKGRSIEDILYADYKDFKIGEDKIFISHVVSLDYEEVRFYIDDYVKILNNLTKKDYAHAVLMVTDVTKNGSYIVFSDSAKDIMETIYDIKDIEVGEFIPGLMSRKKQLLPSVLEVIG